MKYQLIVKAETTTEAATYVWAHLLPEKADMSNVVLLPEWRQAVLTVESEYHDSTASDILNRWLNEHRSAPYPLGSLLWWHRAEEEHEEDGDHFKYPTEEDDDMRYINMGPVSNPDGSPTELTKQMLAGTGRDPEEFARGVHQHLDPYDEEFVGEVHLDHEGNPTHPGHREDAHLEAAYEDAQSADSDI